MEDIASGLVVSLKLAGRDCLVVGLGPEAQRRADDLAAAGARVHRCAPGDFSRARCQGAFLVLCTEPSAGGFVRDEAHAAGALVWVHDRPADSDLMMVARARAGPLTLAVSTGGVAPALARRLREDLAALLAAGSADLAGWMDEARRLRAAGGPDTAARLSALAARVRLVGRLCIAAPDRADGARARPSWARRVAVASRAADLGRPRSAASPTRSGAARRPTGPR